jgi:uncharacterized protein YjbJ (UPF0337 family)
MTAPRDAWAKFPEARTMSEHKAEEMKGRVKEAAGDLTDDKGLQREGKVDQGSAKAKSGVDQVADTVKKAVNPKD